MMKDFPNRLKNWSRRHWQQADSSRYLFYKNWKGDTKNPVTRKSICARNIPDCPKKRIGCTLSTEDWKNVCGDRNRTKPCTFHDIHTLFLNNLMCVCQQWGEKHERWTPRRKSKNCWKRRRTARSPPRRWRKPDCTATFCRNFCFFAHYNLLIINFQSATVFR